MDEKWTVAFLVCLGAAVASAIFLALDLVRRWRAREARRRLFDMLAEHSYAQRRKLGESDGEFRDRIKESVMLPMNLNIPREFRTRENKPTWMTDDEWLGKGKR